MFAYCVPIKNLTNNSSVSNNIINIIFKNVEFGLYFPIICNKDEKIGDIIEKYKNRANSWDLEEEFLVSGKRLNNYKNYNFSAIGFKAESLITIFVYGKIRKGL